MKRRIDDSESELEDESFDFGDADPVDTSYQLIPWTEKYAPMKSGEICINPTKLKQLRTSMCNMLNGSTRLLIVTGPSGSSKSTSVKLLSEEIAGGYIEYFQNSRFDEFLNDCKYLVGKNKKFVLIEELPNVFHKGTLTKFRTLISQWLYTKQHLPPLVICLTEIERNFQSSSHEYFNIENNLNTNTLLGKEIVLDLRVEMVKFNSIAKKFMKQTMAKIIRQELKIFKLIPRAKVDQFINDHDIGDIRSSINNLEIWARYYIKGVNMEEVLNYNRNTTINLFHAIGKVIYSSSKFKDLGADESTWKTLEDVLSNYDNLQLLHLSVLENYTNVLPDLEIQGVDFVADNLSQSELIYGLDEGKDLMIRSARVGIDSASSGVSDKGSFNKINFTKNFKMIKQSNKVSRAIGEVKDSIFNTSFDNVNLIDGFYVPKILNKRFNKQYKRIGGSVNTFLDDDLYEEDNEPIQELQTLEPIEEVDDDILSDPIEDSEDDKPKPTPFDSDYEFLDDSAFS